MGRVGAPYNGRVSRVTALLLLAAAGATAQQPGTTVFTADVRLVTLPVTVKDADGAPLGDLTQADFEILEEGDPREVTVFERRTSRPLSVVVMLDASLSTAIELRYERQSANRFLASLLGSGSQPPDRAAVFSFSAEVEQIQGFTRDSLALQKALGRVRPESGTSVYDAIWLASEQLGRRQGRRVIVVITDGGDTSSRWRFADALKAAHSSEVAIYPLIVLPIQSDAGRNRGGEHALITLAKKTGGETFVQHGTEDLDKAFSEILRALRTQYLLGFYPQLESLHRSELFRTIEVRVRREGATVLARSGYYASPAPVRGRRPNLRAPTNVRRLPQVGEDEQERGQSHPDSEELGKGTPDGRPRPPIVRPEP